MRTDAIVIGAGIVGAACAYELARQGLNVQVLDARSVVPQPRAWGIWSLWMTWKPN